METGFKSVDLRMKPFLGLFAKFLSLYELRLKEIG